MRPTFNPDTNLLKKDIVLTRKVGVNLPRLFFWGLNENSDDFRPGSIIVFRSPLDPERIVVKRIIATEGQTVMCRPPYPHVTCSVPEGHIWVEGDDSFHSVDSNYFGPVRSMPIVFCAFYIV